LNEDGIGDVQHKVQNVFEYLEGNYPRLRLYLHSPAAQALAMAEKMFPVVQGSAEVDAAPLMKPVGLEFASDRAASKRPAAIPLGAVSLIMFGVALAVIRRSYSCR
jgi:hypothetical protein